MRDEATIGRQAMLAEALLQLKSALQLLDSTDAPANIGAHIDLAIYQLADEIHADDPAPHLGQIDRNAELQ
ncbi:MAG TPA: hypothetical protein VFG41_09840 [Sphingomicrobium sp.]|nr:hypothetical protein [Sphingomicrobium sp.]